jgi:hypothetical protein
MPSVYLLPSCDPPSGKPTHLWTSPTTVSLAFELMSHALSSVNKLGLRVTSIVGSR